MNRRDFGLMIAFCLIAGVVWLFFLGSGQRQQVVISVDGKQYATCSLKDEQRIEVESEYGKNMVVIENGSVYVEDADCPDKYCVKQGKLPNGRASIICLPHKMVIEIKGEKKDKKVDAISGS